MIYMYVRYVMCMIIPHADHIDRCHTGQKVLMWVCVCCAELSSAGHSSLPTTDPERHWQRPCAPLGKEARSCWWNLCYFLWGREQMNTVGFAVRNHGGGFYFKWNNKGLQCPWGGESQAVQGAVRSRGTGPGGHCLCRGPAMSYPSWTLRTPWSYTWETRVLLERRVGAFLAVVMRL